MGCDLRLATARRTGANSFADLKFFEIALETAFSGGPSTADFESWQKSLFQEIEHSPERPAYKRGNFIGPIQEIV
jgi:hypothetical protein